MTPCGPTEVTCIHVDRTDGCYGGKWQGTITGTGAPGGSLTFDILQHAITVTVPGSGTGTIDCDTGIGTFTLSGTSMITFHGTWRHTESQGDRISDATWNGTSSTVTGTWDALRIE